MQAWRKSNGCLLHTEYRPPGLAPGRVRVIRLRNENRHPAKKNKTSGVAAGTMTTIRTTLTSTFEVEV